MLVASLSGSLTSFVGSHGLYAVFALMALDAVFPAASELVMLYAGALAGDDRQPRVTPTASTIVSASTISTALATNAAKNRNVVVTSKEESSGAGTTT